MNKEKSIGFDQILSAVFHPLLLPTYGVLLWMRTPFVSLTGIGVLVLLASTLLFTCLCPAWFIFRSWKKGDIDNLRISSIEQRTAPFLLALIGYGCWALLFYFLRTLFFFPVYKVAFGATLAVGLVWLISHWWKISAHLTGWGAFSAALVYYEYCIAEDNLLLLWWLALLAGLLLWARLRINHTTQQALAGWLLGVASVALLVCF